jgi:hypothetical protein
MMYWVAFTLFGLLPGIWVLPAKTQIRPSEIEIYKSARTVTDFSQEELLGSYPEILRDIELTDNQQEMESLLHNIGENVEIFFRDLPNTISKEQVRREQLKKNGSTVESVAQTFNYTAYLDERGVWSEGRTDSRGKDIPLERMSGLSFMTKGYTSASLYFHPKRQFACRFRYLGRERSKPYNHVIAFAQKPEIGSIYGTLSEERLAVPAHLLCQGFIWVDPGSYQIVRMQQYLLAPRIDAYLDNLNSNILYSEVYFKSIARPFWLPREVVVDFTFMGQRFRNRHRYSDYQVFTVAVEEKITPGVPKK